MFHKNVSSDIFFFLTQNSLLFLSKPHRYGLEGRQFTAKKSKTGLKRLNNKLLSYNLYKELKEKKYKKDAS